MPIEETTNESWFSRLGNSFITAFCGILLIPFALSLMWMNEQRNARHESLLQLATSEVSSISSSSMNAELHGTLVHLNDAEAKGVEEMKDARFPMVSMTGGLRLRSTCEVYQCEQQVSEKKKKDNLGGGETTTKTYSYSKKWSKFQIDSSGFKEAGHRNSIAIAGLKVGDEEVVNGTVKYGEGFYLPRVLVTTLNNWLGGDSLVNGPLQAFSCTFEKSDNWYYYPKRPTPEVGDIRVRFEYVPDGPVSVLALQTQDKERPGATFLPYRLVSRGLCGTLTGEALQAALEQQGRKEPEQLYEEDACRAGPLACLCCCCNLITRCFSHLAPPQVFAAWHGHKSKAECMESLQMQGIMLKWGLRLLSWVLLYAACYMLFEPLIVILDIIPFLGKYISSGTSWILAVVILLITAVLATIVISLAYLLYHPLMALVCLACVGLLVGAIAGLSRVL